MNKSRDANHTSEQAHSPSADPTAAPRHRIQPVRHLQRTLGNRLTTRHIRAQLAAKTEPTQHEVEQSSHDSEQTPDASTRINQFTSSGDDTLPPSVRQVLSSSGSPLDDTVRTDMEASLGYDFTSVRVHTNNQAGESAQALNANAYTVGQDIVFGDGRYAPQTSDGRSLLKHELTHVVQQGLVTGTLPVFASSGGLAEHEAQGAMAGDIDAVHTPADVRIQRDEIPKASLDAMQRAMEEAAKRFPYLQAPVRQVTLRAVLLPDRGTIQVYGSGSFTYPVKVGRCKAGFYLLEWQNSKLAPLIRATDLSTGAPPDKDFLDERLKAGGEDVLKRRQGRIGILHIPQTITPPAKAPEPHTPSAAELEYPLSAAEEIDATRFREFLESTAKIKLIIPGITGGIFEPDKVYGRPLNFKYYTQDGTLACVSRELLGREFFYATSVSSIQEFLRTYPMIYGGLSAAPWVPITQFLFHFGISFVPIIGPLIGLAEAAHTGYTMYKNWDQMSGWEKGLGGVTILLSVVPGIRAAKNLAKGAKAYNQGVNALVNAGLPRADATRLMRSAVIFQTERSALRIVDTLGDKLRRGGRLTAVEIQQMRHVFDLMVQRLPVAERMLISASYAAQHIDTAREFLQGVEILERHLPALRRMSPQMLVILKRAAQKGNGALVERVVTWASRSEDVIAGINKLEGVIPDAHLVSVLAQSGDDVIATIGRSSVAITPELKAFVQRARSATEAYRRLLEGTARGKRVIRGLAPAIADVQQVPQHLRAVQQQFNRVILTPGQLQGLSRLLPATQQILRKAGDSQIRAIASFAERSSHAVKAIDDVTVRLGAIVTLPGAAPRVIERMGGGLLELMGREGIQLSDELLTRAARFANRSNLNSAVDVLLRGSRRGIPIKGLLDDLAGKITTSLGAKSAIEALEFGGLRGDFFARWALANPAALKNISEDLAQGISLIARARGAAATQQISGIYRAFAAQHATVIDVFEALGGLQRLQKPGTVLNIERLAAELAAGGSKTMGASLILHFAVKRIKGIEMFEKAVSVGSRERVYDMFADGLYWEFKYWRNVGGPSALAATDEFARDLVYHIGDMSRLRWVISRDVATQRLLIEHMMRGVVARPWVQQALKAKGVTTDEALRRLDTALRGGLLDFF